MIDQTISLWRRWLRVGRVSKPANADGTTTEDRRLWDRYQTNFPTKIRIANGSPKPLGGLIRNISLGGAQVLIDTDSPPEIGQVLSVEFPSASDGEIECMTACVVRIEQTGRNQFSAGIAFSQELSNRELDHICVATPQENPNDLRRAVRFDCRTQAWYHRVDDPQRVRLQAEVLNISASGIGFLTSTEIEAGTLLSFDLGNRRTDTVRTIVGCVVHTTKRANGQTVAGCNFIRELREHELQEIV